MRRRGGHIEGESAEQDQQLHARSRVSVAMAGLPVAQTRQGRGVTRVDADLPAAQVFTVHPRIRTQVGPDEPVNANFAPHLPGRIPPAGWDGEMGAGAPTAGMI
jgi:hypothetical protein